MIEIEGVVEHIVYKNEENGYTVAKIKYNKDLIAAVGFMPFLSEGQRVKVQGEWTVHPTFGQQIKVEGCEEIMPATINGIEKYLSSGLIPGIGPVTAKKIVEKFGMDSLDIIENNPLKLTEVEGIGDKKAAAISEAFEEQRELRQVMVFLQSYGVTPTYAIKIFKKFGNDTVKMVKDNPYRLCDEISGVGFKTADKIAKNLGIDPLSKFRIMSGIRYVLSGVTANGHVYLPKLALYDECSKLLNVPVELMEEALVSLVIEKQVVVEDINGDMGVYLNPLYYSELGVAKRLIELSFQSINEDFKDIDSEIDEYEKENNINFAPEQRDAIIEGVKNGVCVITGGPGTGKTTIIKCIIRIFENRQMNIVLAAPTGRAAKRITETTGYEAKTIHRLLEMEFVLGEGGPSFLRDESNPFETDVIIIDEASMVDIVLMYSLVKAIAQGTRLVMVGDVDQLPSVGPGNVLRDIIESASISVVKLNRIFRQSDESLITLNAHKINNGEMPVLNDKEKDFFFLQRNINSDIVDGILELVSKRLSKFKGGFDPLKDMQILSPMRKGEIGIYNLNLKLQEILNPPSNDKNEKQFRDYTFRVGDKVMQIKNNYNIEWISLEDNDVTGTGVFNGDIGFVTEVDSEAQKVSVVFEDKKVDYEFSNLDELELAYAITIHKSQGSEFPVVIIPSSYGPPMLMTRNLIYTGVTRAKKLVVIVGTKQGLANMINNNTIARRYSGLKERIINIMSIIK